MEFAFELNCEGSLSEAEISSYTLVFNVFLYYPSPTLSGLSRDAIQQGPEQAWHITPPCQCLNEEIMKI